MSDEEDDRVRLSTTVPKDSLDWLRERYPDATSDSMRLVMAISDARDFEELIGCPRDVEIRVPRVGDD